jgi:stage II sporulation protein D
VPPEQNDFADVERSPERLREGAPLPVAGRFSVPAPRLVLTLAAAAFLAAFFVIREVPPARVRALAAYPAGLTDAPDLRVALVRSPEGVRVSVTGRFELIGGSGEAIATQNESLAPARVRSSAGGLAVGETRLPRHASLGFIPAPGEEVRIDGTPLPGTLRIVRDEEGSSVAAVATLDVESYVCAALAATADWRRWSDETLAAHAVAIRTHALYRRSAARGAERRGGEAPPWDFEEPAVLRTMREGAHRSARVALAVNGTLGLVLSWDRRLFPAYVTRACGGRTEDASNVFTTSSITPLSSVECPWCLKVPYRKSSWTAKLRLDAIRDRLLPYAEADGGYKLGSIERIQPVTAKPTGPRHPGQAVTDPTARVTTLRIDAAFGPCEVPAGTFRKAIGEDVLPSAMFTIEEVGPETLEFRGRGEGHGVGLCQHGAEQMAREGRGYRDILRRYYPGAQIARLPYAGSGD